MQQDRPIGPDTESFALDELIERVDGDEGLIREVLGIFLEDAPKVLENLRTSIKGGSPEAVANAAHTLKGSSANISANRLREKAYRLEMKAKSGDLADAFPIYAEIEAEFGELKDLLNQYLGK
ncbi:MAG: Hpt domain-containing protein [Desulfobacterales bacterium]|nr:Hpt domain-containing protein [Desulfobacterales bacterium]